MIRGMAGDKLVMWEFVSLGPPFDDDDLELTPPLVLFS